MKEISKRGYKHQSVHSPTKTILSILMIIVCLFSVQSLHAQNKRKLTGIVKDNNGNPITGASVVVKGTTNGTITDPDGKFSIKVTDKSTLKVTFIGYYPYETKVEKKNFLRINLQENSKSLNEVVVVGYGTQRKVTTTGAVDQVKGDDLNLMTVANPTKALQGLSPGITIIDRGGAPGGDDPDIFLRGVSTTGNSKPLILVDGIEMSLSQVPPSEIESISVLKDAASASIYGSRGANGVILVTTKHGKQGKINVSYEGSIGFQDRAIKAKPVSARDYMSMVNEALVNAGSKPKYSESDISLTEQGTDLFNHAYYNWPSELYKPNYITQHTLTVNGGNEAAKFLVSFNYLDQPGLTPNTNYNRYNYRANTEIKINRYFKFSSDLTYLHIDRVWPQRLGNAQTSIYSMTPTCPMRYPTTGEYVLDQQHDNSLAYTDMNVVGAERYNRDAIYGQAKIDYEPIKDLVFTGLVSLNGNWDRDKTHYKNHKFYDDKGNLVIQSNDPNGVTDARNNNYELTLRFLANYHKNFQKKHDLSILYGMEQISYRNYYSMAQRKYLISDDVPDVSMGSADNQFAEGYPDLWGISSFFGRVNYGYKDRYLIEANLRADGASRFAKGHKWGVFPAFSAGWRISEEPFMKNVTAVTNLKLRASWGQAGNENIGEFMYLPQYKAQNVVMNNQMTTGVYQQLMANPDITWETVQQTDIGLDFGFLNNEIYGELDWYSKDTKDILLALPIPKFIGLDPPEQNAGVVRNSGIEAMIGFRKKFNDFTFSASANVTYNHNQWVDRKTADKSISGNIIQSVGSSLNAFYIYEADGLIANDQDLADYKAKYKSDPRGMSQLKAGDVKLVDRNGDGKIDPDDRKIYQGNMPSYNYSLNLGAQYKGFDLSVLFQGSAGSNVMLEGEFVEGPSYEVFTGQHYLDRWTVDNPNPHASMPRLEAANNRNTSTYNSFFLKDCSYLRLKNLQIGYTIPRKLIERFKVNKLRVYLSGSNLLTFSSLPQGLDPEEASGRLHSYPALRIFNFGVNINF